MEKNLYKRDAKLSVRRMVLLACAILFAFFAKAENQAPNANAERLDSYLKKIEQAYKVSFVFDAEEINKNMLIDVPARLTNIKSSLEQLKQKNIGYTLIGSQVVLKVMEPTKTKVVADIIVKGHVKDKKDGSAMPGVSIKEKGTANTVSTNTKGDYQIKVKDGATIIASFIGYKQVQIAVNGRTTIDISLEEDAAQLQEVNVVSTGYQTLEKKTFTGSSTTIKASDAERPGVPDISRMLEGQVAGVTVQNVSGTFGAAPKIRVRGATSLTGDNKPLWVIDGIILEDVVNISNEALTTGDASTLLGSSVAGLNADDIEDISILKDAAATGMYGARAMNGVVIVTTKKGKSSQSEPRVSYTGNFTTYAKPSYANTDILNSADQMGVMIELQNKGYYNMPTASRGASGGVFYKMYNLMYDYDPATDSFALRNDNFNRNAFLKRYAEANTDWFDVLFKNSLQQEHSLSVSSGTDKFQSYASTSYLNDKGLTIGNNVSRFTGNYRANFKFSDKLSAELLTNGSVRSQKTPGASNLQSDSYYGMYYREFDVNPYNYVLETSRVQTAYDKDGNLEYFRLNSAPYNIVNELNSNTLNLNMIDFKVQGGATYKIIPSLTYNVIGSYRFSKSESQISILENSNMARAYRIVDDVTSAATNKYLYKDPSNPNAPAVSVLPNGGFYKMSGNSLKNYYVRHSLQFNKELSKDHSISAFAGMEVRYIDRQQEAFDGVGYQFDNGGLVTPNYLYFKQSQEAGKAYFSMGNDRERYVAYILNGAYTYKEKYTIKLNGRYDGSNKMGKTAKARWLPTWNASASWNVSDEEFFPKNDIVTGVKLRGSYGLVASIGNSSNSAAEFYNRVSYRNGIADQEVQTYISALENSELTWEKTKDFNIGIDASLLKNRVNITLDYYRRNIYDLIGTIQTSGIGGEYTKVANYATMKGNGFEFSISGSPIQGKDFKWKTNFNFGYNTNKIVRLDIDPSIYTGVSPNGTPMQGYPSRSLFSVQFAGLNHDYGYPTFIGTDGKVTPNFSLRSTDFAYMKYEGPIDAPFAGGFYNQFSYKNFTVSALVGFSAGNFLRLKPTIKNVYNDMTSMTRDALNRWVIPGDEQYTNIPALIDPYTASKIIDANGTAIDMYFPYNIFNYSTERVAKGDYIKLKQIALSYNLPKEWYTKLHMKNASLSLVGNNVWVIYSDKKLNGQDPEFYTSGGVALPLAAQFTLSLKIGF